MADAVADFTSVFPGFLSLSGAGLGLWLAASALYILLSPYRQLNLTSVPNISAGIVLGSTLFGLGLPIIVCIILHPDLITVLLWSVVLLLLNMCLFRIADGVIGPLNRILEKNLTGDACLLSACKLTLGLIFAVGLYTSASAH